MREAAIDRRGASPRSRGHKARQHGILAGLATPVLRLMRAHPAKTALGAILLLGMGVIVSNATLFQRGRHPAPLFGTPPHASSAPATAAVPIPRSRPNEFVASTPSAPAIAPSPSAVPSSDAASSQAGREDGIGRLLERGSKLPVVVTHSAQATPAKPSTPKEDGIAKLLETGGKPQTASQGGRTAAADIIGAQRALQKLGYDIKPDGHLGTATRQALEKFQRGHHLPVDGALSPKILHQLGVAQSLPRG